MPFSDRPALVEHTAVLCELVVLVQTTLAGLLLGLSHGGKAWVVEGEIEGGRESSKG